MLDKIANCVPTLAINLNAVLISFANVEAVFRVLSYFVAIVWTTLKIIELLKEMNKKK